MSRFFFSYILLGVSWLGLFYNTAYLDVLRYRETRQILRRKECVDRENYADGQMIYCLPEYTMLLHKHYGFILYTIN